ncbi:signal transducer and transcription activator-like [Sitodiplosis mosellana]|uniref:signal transducer and transcription activator-like n=1 Tax=Sitodiplosis mosellana TaxID=263140 RepID=UPI002444820D|nr:signal transducer and transcription activator-like [Sitodiplosis mosellana]
MVSFCELMSSEEQCNEQLVMTVQRIELREFESKIEQISPIVNDYRNNDTANKYQTEHAWNNKLYIDYSHHIQNLSMESTMRNVELEQSACVEKAREIWLIMEQNCKNILTRLQFVVGFFNEAQHILIDKLLGRWKHNQIMFLYGEGGPRTQSMIQTLEKLKIELYQIQTHFEQLFDYVWYTHSLVSVMRECHAGRTDVDTLANEIAFIQQKLLLSSFVVVEQPPQVIHSNVQFEAIVRVLLTRYIASISNPLVWVVSESQVKTQHQHHKEQEENKQQLTSFDEKWAEIRYTDTAFESQLLSLECNLKDLKLKIKRIKKKDVMDDKFALRFHCTLTIKGHPNLIDIWTTSLPVTVTTNVSQDADGWATITWDNSFFEIGRDPFDVPESVPWSHVKMVLFTRFYYQTGHSLTEQHTNYLYKKLFKTNPSTVSTDRPVSWNEFGKAKSQDFTFFAWFHDVTKLVRLYLREEWGAGLIEGFISKDEAWEKLRNCAPGTFLLRFSDSQLGAISVASVKNDPSGFPVPDHMDPYVDSDFEQIRKSKPTRKLTIGDLLKDLNQYTVLQTVNRTKHDAFAPHYTKDEPIPRANSAPYSGKQKSMH